MYNLKNYNEEVVLELTTEMMAEVEMCQCEKCKFDIMALALNQLKPCYVVTFKGFLLANLEATKVQSQADALSAVLHGINQVKANPQHDTFPE